MSGSGEIPPISRPGFAAYSPSSSSARPGPAGENGAANRPGDRSEFTELSRLLSKLSQLPDVRQDKIDEAKALIASGEMEADHRIEGSLDDLLDDLMFEFTRS